MINIEEKLNQLSLHDKPLSSFEVLYEKKEIRIVVLDYNEETKNYNNLQLIFTDVIEFEIPFSSNIDDQEVTDFELSKIKDYYKIEIKVLTGFGNPCYTIEIVFKEFFSNLF